MLAKTSILLLVSFFAIDPNSLCVNAVNAHLDQPLMRRQPEQKPLETKARLVPTFEAVDSSGLVVKEKLEPVNVAHNRAEHATIVGANPDDPDDKNLLEQAEDDKVRGGKGRRKKKTHAPGGGPIVPVLTGAACRDIPLNWRSNRRRTNKSCQMLAGLIFGAGTKSQMKDKKPRNVCRAGTMQGNHARKFCCKTCKTAPMGAIFGGETRGAEVNGRMQLPEEVRAQQCTHEKCQECGNKANCFQGSHGTTGNRWGPISTLDVQPGESFTSYRSSSYAKCETGDLTELSVKINAMHNGIVKVFVNGIHKKTLMGDGGDIHTHGGGGGGATTMWHEKHGGGGGAIQLSVEFFPTDLTAKSSVVVQVEMDNVRPEFEQCMDHKTCLADMGNMKSEASYALRNKNEYQLSCLRRSPTLPSFLKNTCAVWRSCVEKNPELAKVLQTSLSAANPSLLQVEATSVTKATRQQDECLDPSIADIEAFSCECMVWLQEKCGDDEECFKSKFCAFPEVCIDWKKRNGCPPDLLQAESNSPKAYMALAAKRRSLQREITSSANILTDDVDSAMQGKCSSQ